MHLQNQKYWDDPSILSHVEAQRKKSHENMSYWHRPSLSKKNKKNTQTNSLHQKNPHFLTKKNSSV